MQDDDITIERDGLEEHGGSEAELEEREGRADTKLAKLRKELETAKRESREHLDGWQRAKADYVNALRRHDEERAGIALAATARAAGAFLPAMDSLARAEAAGEIPESFAGIAKQLHGAASSLGLGRFGQEGEAFDPALHEALGQDEVLEVGKDGTITVVLEQGWRAGDAVLRPAKVRVGTLEG
jgi:molecular chaperone GrpE